MSFDFQWSMNCCLPVNRMISSGLGMLCKQMKKACIKISFMLRLENLNRYLIIKCNIYSHTWGKWSWRDTWVSLHRSLAFPDPISILKNLICILLPWLRPYLLWRCPPSILSIGGASIIHWQRVLGGYRPGLWKPGLCNI